MAALLDPEKALSLVIEATKRADVTRVPIREALGLTLAQQVRADRDHPPFNRAAMDGYAICLTDAGREAEVVGVVAAGQRCEMEVAPGRCVEIMTGAPCPRGSEAVVMKEDVQRKGERVLLPGQVKRGQHIAERGQECRSGALVLSEGEIVTPLAIAVLASFGQESVSVVAPPSLAIITTGDELVKGAAPPAEAQIRNSNGPMITAQARAFPLADLKTMHAEDSMASLLAALDRAKNASVVVITGGVSAGASDLVPAALAEYGAATVFHKVAQKPGKPLLFAKHGEQLLFGLPGNPVSSNFCFNRYVTAALRKKLGREPGFPRGRGRLVRDLDAASDRVLFVPSRVTREADSWKVDCLENQGSADIYSIVSANAYAVFAPGDQRRAGDLVVFEPIVPLP